MSKCSTEAPFCISPTPTGIVKTTPVISPSPVYITPTPTILSPIAIEKERCEDLVFDSTKFPTITSSKNFDINTYNSQITSIENATDNSFIIQQASTIDKSVIDVSRDNIFNNIGDTRFNAAAAFTFLKTRFKPLEPEDESFKKPLTIPVISCNADGDPYTFYINNSSIILDGCNKNTIILPIYDMYGQIVSFPLKNSFDKLLTTEAITAIDSTNQLIYFPLKNVNNDIVCYPFRDLSQNILFSLPTQNTDRLVDVTQARVNLSVAYDNARDAHALKFAKYIRDLEKKGICISFFVSVVGSSVTSLELDNVEVFGVAVYKTCPECAELTDYLSKYINCFIRYYPDRACYVYDVYKKLGGKSPFTRLNTEESNDIFISEKASYLAYNILKSPFWSPTREVTLLPCERRTPTGSVTNITITENKIINIYNKFNDLSARLEECCNKSNPLPTPFPTQTSNSTPFPTQTPMPTPGTTPGSTPAPTPLPTVPTTPAATPPSTPPVCDPIPVIIISNVNSNTYDPRIKFPGGTDSVTVQIQRGVCGIKAKPGFSSPFEVIFSVELDWSKNKYPNSRTTSDNIMSRAILIGSKKQGDYTLSPEALALYAPRTTTISKKSTTPFVTTPDLWPLNWVNETHYWEKEKAMNSDFCLPDNRDCVARFTADKINYTVSSQGVSVNAKFGGTSGNKWLDPSNPNGDTTLLFGATNPCLKQLVNVTMIILNNKGGILHPFEEDVTDPLTGITSKKAKQCMLGRGGGTWTLDMGINLALGDTIAYTHTRPIECFRVGDPKWDGGTLAFYWEGIGGCC